MRIILLFLQKATRAWSIITQLLLNAVIITTTTLRYGISAESHEVPSFTFWVRALYLLPN